MIEAEEMEEGGVEVMDADAAFDGTEPEFVGGTVSHAAADTGAGQPDAEAVVIVIATELGFAAIAQFDGWGSTELTAPEDEGVLEETALFEIGHEGGDGAIDVG